MLSGDRLLGHYRLVHRIGSGGMGEVYLAEDTRINRQVAIKVVRTETELYPDPVMMQEKVSLFQREMRAIIMLDHPHILPLFDFGEEKDGNLVLIYMVMPYRQEGSLVDWLQKRGKSERLTPGEVSHFVVQAADALQHAHSRNLVHQDVKPSNFLVRSREGNVLPDLLLMDFGIAKINTGTVTASQSVRGTPSFMAPEQWEGQPQPATDQYALAVMTYLLLTGSLPFSGQLAQVMHQHYMVQPQPPGSFNPAIPPAVDAVILRALEKQSARRFPSILEFALALQQSLQFTGHPDSPVVTPQNSPIDSAVLPLSIYPAPLDNPALVVPMSDPNLSMPPPLGPAPTISSPDTGTPIPLTPYSSAGRRVSSIKRSVWMFVFLFALVILVIIASIVTVDLYQNHVTQVNISTSTTTETAAYPSQSYPSYLSGNGILAFLDPLDQESGSEWSSSSTNGSGGACEFNRGAYHVSQQVTNAFMPCYARGTFSNFAFEVQLTIAQGDCGGMVFRDDGNGRFYSFSICQDSRCSVRKYASNSSSILSSRDSSAIISGPGQQNKVALVASGSTLIFYVNEQRIDQVQDNSYVAGNLSLIAATSYGNATEVVYSDARLWTL